MTDYRELRTRYGDLLAKLEPISAEAAEEIRNAVPAIPDDYIVFLVDVGPGELGEAMFMLYDGPVPAEEIYPNVRGIWLIGDDFSGYAVGFEDATWRVVEADPSGMVADVAPTFDVFIRQKLADLSE